jgi:hypothetical protein
MPSHKKKQNLSSKTWNIFTQSLQALSSSSYSSSFAVSWELVRRCDEEPVRPVMMISLKFGTPCQTDHHVLQLVEGSIDPACFKSLGRSWATSKPNKNKEAKLHTRADVTTSYRKPGRKRRSKTREIIKTRTITSLLAKAQWKKREQLESFKSLIPMLLLLLMATNQSLCL